MKNKDLGITGLLFDCLLHQCNKKDKSKSAYTSYLLQT